MSLRIGFIKPDHGFRGGFEVLVDQLAEGLRGRGHDVAIVAVDAVTPPRHLYGVLVNGAFHQWHNEYFNYLTLAERTQRLALDDFDVVVATQPPTWHARHDNLIGLFFHQGRVFYDLSEEFVDSGFVDPTIHAAAVRSVRSLDDGVIANVKHWLAGSDSVAERLLTYWQVPSHLISPYRHPALAQPAATATADLAAAGSTSIAMVSRHEWPKRTELAVAAGRLLTKGTRIDAVGGGSRLSYVEDLDGLLDTGIEPSPDSLWKNQGGSTAGWSPSALPPSGRVAFHDRLTDAERDAIVAGAAAVVAPAYAEDYGLTALETFAARKPLIVCTDGGGLTEFVSHGETGLAVEPTPNALAEAMDQLVGDPELAAHLANAGHELGRSFTIDAALDQFEAALP